MEPDRYMGSDEARSNFRALLDDVEQHDTHVTIQRHGKPVAVVVPVEWYERGQILIEERDWLGPGDDESASLEAKR